MAGHSGTAAAAIGALDEARQGLQFAAITASEGAWRPGFEAHARWLQDVDDALTQAEACLAADELTPRAVLESDWLASPTIPRARCFDSQRPAAYVIAQVHLRLAYVGVHAVDEGCEAALHGPANPLTRRPFECSAVSGSADVILRADADRAAPRLRRGLAASRRAASLRRIAVRVSRATE